jgi:glycosyltransferase involved in cell wall biosynthesis
MDWAKMVITVVLALAAIATLVYWSVALFKVLRTRAQVPTARAGLSLPEPKGGWPEVCIVVPAHNEQEVIGRLAKSLRAQDYPRLRVVLSLDRCTDATAARAREAIDGDERFEILELTACAEGWAGKVHAVHSGVTRSKSAKSAEMILFADADTEFDPGCVRACVALMCSRGDELLSLLSTLTTERWFETVLQPAAGLELMRQYPITHANLRENRRAFANGQFMLFNAEAYRAIGGHEAVRDELLEDLALARRMAYAGRPTGVYLADGLLHCRMYNSLKEFARGWKRIYTEAAKRRDDRLTRSSWQARLCGSVLPTLGALLIAASPFLGETGPGGDSTRGILLGLGIASTLAYAAALAVVYRMGRTPLWCLPMHPVGAWFTAGLLRAAARDLRRGVPTTWAGRSYVRPRRRAGDPE